MDTVAAVIFDLDSVPDQARAAFVALLAELRAAGVKTAVESSLRSAPALAQAWPGDGLALVDAVVDATLVSRPKPDPAALLLGARLLGLPAGLILAVQGTAAGLEAGSAAGMWTLGVGPIGPLGDAGQVAPDWSALTLERLSGWAQDAAWTVRRVGDQAESRRHRETLFTIGNGHLSLRGGSEEGGAGEESASFMHGVWDDMPVSRTELANLPRWWGLDLWANGVRFRPGQGQRTDLVRSLDLRDGVLTRQLVWSPDDRTDIALRFERFLSLADPHLGALRVGIEVRRGEADLSLRGGLDAHVDNQGLRHWDLLEQSAAADTVGLLVRTRHSGVELALAGRLSLGGAALRPCQADGQPALWGEAKLTTGQTLTALKVVACASTAESPDPGAVVAGALPADLTGAWDDLRRANRAAWDQTWAQADVEIVGDPASQVALRYNIFQLLIAAPRLADASIGAKTLSGYGYRHHVFWDTEVFALPLFTHTQPALARRMLEYRWNRLPGARRKARESGRAGALFPWESAGSGDEVTPRWVEDAQDPTHLIRIWTGDIELHLNADLAWACHQYWRASGDDAFMRDHGAEIVCDTALFWAEAAQLEDDGHYHLRDVIGPDEYHEHVDDNAFTNLMAAWHLRLAVRALGWLSQRFPDRAVRLRAELGLGEAVEAAWLQVADRMAPPRRSDGAWEQFAGYFDLAEVDFDLARDPARRQSMQQICGLVGTQSTRNIKQPDVLMLAHLLPDLFSEEELQANYRYYDPRTDHELGSSLGPAVSAIVACRVGDDERAYEHFRRAAQADLFDVRHNAGDGIHAASAGGLWQAVVFGFAGLRLDDTGWRLEPRLPRSWRSVTFGFRHSGQAHRVTVRSDRPV
ncbi:MAG: hypothetical protein LBJ44_00585 [Propionibacteriaceae bacterium]|jgi:kojibiose phosphorylase|nr:hypothetical protein [Propionibacteriaceae bacterium]